MFRARRITKSLLGIGVIGLFGVYPVYTLMQPSSVEAVLNARVFTLRAPIGGRIGSIQPLDDARVVPHGTEIVTVENDRADRSRIEDLESQRGRLASEQTAILAKRLNATAEGIRLTDSVDRFRQGRTTQLTARRSELLDQIAAAELRQDEATSTLERFTSLAQSGTLSDVDRARAARAASIASLDVQTLHHRMTSIDQEIQAAKAGVFIGDGSNNDQPSSFQRAETVRNEIAALQIEHDRNEAEIERITGELGRESRRFDHLSTAALTVPVDGRIWERLVSSGEEVMAGQPLLRLVDCSTSVITANVTERVYNGLTVGTHATFVPADGGDDLVGSVVSLTGVGNAAANFAIEPSALSKQPYRVTISLSGVPNATTCSIGRTGRVAFNETGAATP